MSVGGGFGCRLLRGCWGVLGCGPGWGRLMSGLSSWVGWCRGCWWSVLWVGVGVCGGGLVSLVLGCWYVLVV